MYSFKNKQMLKFVYFNVNFSRISSRLCRSPIIPMNRSRFNNDQCNSRHNRPYSHFLVPEANRRLVPIQLAPLPNQFVPQSFIGYPVQNRRYFRTEHRDKDPQDMNALRQWESVSANKGGFVFSVMSFNILAQDLLVQHSYLYKQHKPHNLAWNIRWNNIFAEIKKLNPDILCLQEVQISHIDTNFSALKSLGYQYIFKKRTGTRTDGCAIYYKANLLKLLEYTTVEFNQPEIQILNRDNIGIIAKFSPLHNAGAEFVVANTHLLFNPKRQDVRLAQAQLFLTEIDRMAFKQEPNRPYLPVIITGDFNSEPNSIVYRFLSEGLLKYEHLAENSLKNGEYSSSKTGKVLIPASLGITDDCQHVDLMQKRNTRQSLSRSEELKLIKIGHSERVPQPISGRLNCNSGLFSSGTLRHGFKLVSVYQHRLNGDWEATTHQDQWISVDYIFFSNTTLRLLDRYKLPAVAQLRDIRIPNELFGSDHFCLCARFTLG